MTTAGHEQLQAARTALFTAVVGKTVTTEELDGLIHAYDTALDEVIDVIGDPEIDAFVTAARALETVNPDHLRRRVHKALGVLMLEPTPSPLEKLAEALPELVRMLGPILAQGTGPVVETTEEPDAYADGMVVPHTGAPSGFGIYFGHTVHDLEQWLAAQKAQHPTATKVGKVAAQLVRGESKGILLGPLFIVYPDGRSVEVDEATAEKLGFPLA